MLETAQATAAEYDRLAQQAKDPFQREMLDQLVREGNRHVELAQRLIEIVDE
jgi:rubrerythrin